MAGRENMSVNVVTESDGADGLNGTSGYTTVVLSSGSVHVESSSVRVNVVSIDGTQTVYRHNDQVVIHRDVEELRFLDGRVVLDENDPAAQVVRLYQAALGRPPDQSGLNFWIDRLEHGARLGDLGEAFLRSPEFEARFGRLDDAGYVDRLYRNVLGRPGDADEKVYWLDRLQGGASRQDVLAGFAESPENKTATRDLLAAGIWDRSETAQQVARLYDAVLGRLPDASGLGYWRGRLDDGSATAEDVADAFSRSAEFTSHYGGLSNRDFVEALYRNTLGRAGDAGGVEYWTWHLDAGTRSRAATALGFSESAEHVARTAPLFASDDPAHYGITLAG